MKTSELYAEMLTTLGAANTQETEQTFLMSLKKVVGDLNQKLKTEIVAPTQVDGSDIGFEDYCDNTFHPGVKFYMQRDGAWSQDPDQESYAFYQRQLRSVIGSAIASDDSYLIRNQASE
jgi:hypothetical protein